MEITLFIAPGSCARVPTIALEQAGVAFDTRIVRFARGEHRGPDYLRLNPAGKVPLLIVDGRAIAQNVAILHWLARTFPDAGLLPRGGDAIADAQILGRLAWCAADLHQLVTRMRLPALACDLPDAAERVRTQAAVAMAAQLAGVEADLARQPWLLGDDWSVLDAYIFWIWFRITGAGFPAERFPRLAGHARRMAERPAVARALAREAAAQAELEAAGAAMRFPDAAAIRIDP